MTMHIYHLLDAEDGLVRYVGKAVDPAKRLKQHMRGNEPCTPRMREWIRRHRLAGQRPTMRVIATVAGTGTAEERKEIRKQLAGGAALFNHVNNPVTLLEKQRRKGTPGVVRLNEKEWAWVDEYAARHCWDRSMAVTNIVSQAIARARGRKVDDLLGK